MVTRKIKATCFLLALYNENEKTVSELAITCVGNEKPPKIGDYYAEGQRVVAVDEQGSMRVRVKVSERVFMDNGEIIADKEDKVNE